MGGRPGACRRGSLTLIKASLVSIPIHYLSLLVLPITVCSVLEKIQRDFLWRKGEDGKGIHLVSWERVCAPKEGGGVETRCLKAMNKALLCKWLWRFEKEPECLWRQVVAAKFGEVDGWNPSIQRGSCGCSPWRGIMKFISLFRECVAFEVGDGRRVKFWEDAWCGEQSLKHDFPDLVNLAVDPSAMVAENMSVQSVEIVWNPVFRWNLFDWEIPQVINLLARLQASHINLGLEDRRVWKMATGNEFSVKSFYGYVNRSRVNAEPWKEI